jgi:uncharacterized repeat protein (TIGR03806 family)
VTRLILPALLAGLAAAPADPAGVPTSRVVGSPDPAPYKVRRTRPNFSPAYPVNARPIPGTDQLIVITEDAPYSGTHLVRVPDRPDAADAQAVRLMSHAGVAYDLAFHPKFAENGFLYVGWNGKTDGRNFTRVTRFRLDPKPPYTLDPASAATVIEWPSAGHNGGAVCFGPDGMLYVTSGDGTADSDGDDAGQRTDTLLSKVLRIDVDRPGQPYAVPPDNPFVGNPAFRPETWAYGLRNPWRVSADAETGQLWVGNNGQDLWEQAYLVRKGANYGWSVTEGGHPFFPLRKAGPTPIQPPTVEHPHSESRSLTGGLVYRGTALPELVGAYVYGDYATGRVWAVKHDGQRVVWHKELARTQLKITAFFADSRGELLILDHQPVGKGGLYELVPNTDKPAPFPAKLSGSGLFASVADHAMAPGVFPYEVNAPFWSDGLFKQRWLALPPGGKVGWTKTGGWNFPDRTVVVKSFAVGEGADRKWVETRFLTKQDGEWAGYSYVWDADGKDAMLVGPEGLDRQFGAVAWRYPSRTECMVCHSRAANHVLGLCTPQMNRASGVENQIARFERLGLFDGKLPKPPGEMAALVDPYDATQDLGRRARSWLHANCSNCHVEAGGGNARMELEVTTPADKMRALGERPLHQTFDLPDARLVAPGRPERSVLLHRAMTRGPGQMPPLASRRPDEAGVRLLREWIESLR